VSMHAEALYAKMGPGIEASGGSAANTVAGVAALGSRAGFIGQVADDQLGKVFTHDIRALGVHFDTPARPANPPTARCLILVTPDAQRTMNTFLGASQFLPANAIDLDLIRSAAILYLEGYLWDPEEPRAAMRLAIDTARSAGRKVALTLSDAFCIERHRGDFQALLDNGQLDILFANEAEILSLNETDSMTVSLQLCARALVMYLEAALARIWTFNERDGMLELQASAGLYTPVNGPHGRVPIGQFKIGRIARDRSGPRRSIPEPRIQRSRQLAKHHQSKSIRRGPECCAG